ncbi:ADP-ribosylglycohydrolase family protein [Labrys sp. La1]|uniref:ADP-ribosylglycohydrolase family protein n=1 Tax=Labrys sp. La1 TaxID=3404917 RepID=UPI003EBF4B92
MALCLAASLQQHKQLDPRDCMNRFVNWWRYGHLSAIGECFDIGGVTTSALARYEANGNPFAGPTAPDTAGNGSLDEACSRGHRGPRGSAASLAGCGRPVSPDPRCRGGSRGLCLFRGSALRGPARCRAGNRAAAEVLAGWASRAAAALRRLGLAAGGTR